MQKNLLPYLQHLLETVLKKPSSNDKDPQLPVVAPPTENTLSGVNTQNVVSQSDSVPATTDTVLGLSNLLNTNSDAFSQQPEYLNLLGDASVAKYDYNKINLIIRWGIIGFFSFFYNLVFLERNSNYKSK
jgi:hypothetical protein